MRGSWGGVGGGNGGVWGGWRVLDLCPFDPIFLGGVAPQKMIKTKYRYILKFSHRNINIKFAQF